jgi:hypothetical protein
MSNKPPIRDLYDLMPPEISAAQRRHNKERLAALEADGESRRARLALVLGAHDDGAGS